VTRLTVANAKSARGLSFTLVVVTPDILSRALLMNHLALMTMSALLLLSATANPTLPVMIVPAHILAIATRAGLKAPTTHA